MKRLLVIKVIFMFLVILCILLVYSPFMPRIKSHLVSLLSDIEIKNKNNEKVPGEAYHWELTDGNNLFRFEQFRGKVAVVNFWATWCRPCIEEMPSFQELYNSYGNKVDFLFVAQDEMTKVNVLFNKKGFSLPVYYSRTKVPEIFFSRTIPTTFVIDKKGKIVLAKSDSANWNHSEIHALLDNLLKE